MLSVWFASILIFNFGLYSLVTNERSVIHTLISFELIYLSFSLILASYSVLHQNYIAQVIVLVVLACVAAEAAIGLSLLVFRFNIRSTINLASLCFLMG